MTELDRIPDWMAPDVATRGLDLKGWAQDFRDVYQVAEALCKTAFVPREMLGKQADVTAAIMKGRELGLDPFDALGSIYIVHGRVGYYAEFMRRRIIQAGHTLRIIEQTDNRCVIEGVRKGGEPQRASFTAEQARKAQLNLGAYPADKLLARATSRLCRQVFPDVLSGTLIAEDIIDGLVPVAGEPEDAPPPEAGPALKRARKPRPVKAASTQPPEQPAAVAEPEVDDLLDEAQAIYSSIPLRAVIDKDTTGHVEAAGAEETPPEEPEPLITEPDDVRMITDQQMKLLQIRFKEQGFTERQARLDYAASVIGRALASSTELTTAEASKLIDSLEN